MCLAVPGRLLSVQGEEPLERSGRVSFGGVVKEVSLACTPEAREGDYVLVHVGVAIGVVGVDEARETLRYLREMGELEGIEPAAPPGPP